MSWSYTLDALAVSLEAQRPGDATRFSRVSTDTRTLQEGDVFFALRGENFDGHDYVKQAFEKGAAAAVVDTSLRGRGDVLGGSVLYFVSDTLEALQQFAAWHRRQLKLPVVAITGSCGKTSTKDMIAAVLGSKFRVVKTQGNLNNEIGLPLSLLQIDRETDIAVLEMGANHRGEIKRLCEIARPTESLITMVAEAHLEGFGGIEAVAAAKAEIMEGLEQSGIFYVNLDNEYTRTIGERFSGKKVYVGGVGPSAGGMSLRGRNDILLRSCRFEDDGEMELDIAPIGKLKLPLHARAHATNVLFAVAVGLEHGVTEFEGPLRAALEKPSRFKVMRVGPLTVIDDSYNANPASMEASLQALADRPGGGRRFAALGSMLELGAESGGLHRRVGEAASRAGVAEVFAFGPEGAAIVEGAGMGRVYETHEAIAAAVRDVAGAGDVLLVKGSRGMRMEKVIEGLRELYEGKVVEKV